MINLFFGKKNEKTKEQETIALNEKEIEKKKGQLGQRKKYSIADYETLLAPYINSYENLRLIDYVRETEIGDRQILLIRHDVDHDHLTAQKMAKWEYDHGLQTTYCLLHTAWYYGELQGDRIIHTTDLIDCAKRLYDLGHEINFHNNLVVTALKEKINPVKLLEQELEFFESIGVPVSGSSTHGDPLCRQLNFRNWEFFKECCDERFGGPRTVTLQKLGHSVEIALGEHSMFDFGLEYEAYDIVRDIYHTDSGGNLRIRQEVRGRRPFGRNDYSRGKVIGILTHPVWWNFDSYA
ncbi:MAG TPA: hypothetical protein DD379_12440 [Cyanobacteria bacterium UBA11162]|nr:hypothetical protein [Cyanobacteria bacterium UBA11162]